MQKEKIKEIPDWFLVKCIKCGNLTLTNYPFMECCGKVKCIEWGFGWANVRELQKKYRKRIKCVWV